jgi:transposase InsO family protein
LPVDGIKTEVINFLGPWKSVGQVEWETLKWVNWYNIRSHGLQANHCGAAERPHSAIGYITPQEAEKAFYANLNKLV